MEKRCKEKRRNKELNKYIHRYERTDIRVTKFRYLPFDQGWRKTRKTRVAPKRNTKTM
jgi:hypothetical protein